MFHKQTETWKREEEEIEDLCPNYMNLSRVLKKENQKRIKADWTILRLDRIWKAQLGALQNPGSNSQTLRAATPPSLRREETKTEE